VGNDIHLALVYGDIHPDQPVLVRVHVQNTLCDLFEGLPECGWPLRSAMDFVVRKGGGVIVVLRNYDTARDIVNRIEELKHGRKPEPRADGKSSRNDADLRTIGVGAQILVDLGVRKMRVMSAPKHLHALAGFDLEVTEFVNTDEN
jgi:3,4-dihydroxy 2-butanone 4-phosphate synthase/GTP cyclohydrolase II